MNFPASGFGGGLRETADYWLKLGKECGVGMLTGNVSMAFLQIWLQ